MFSHMACLPFLTCSAVLLHHFVFASPPGTGGQSTLEPTEHQRADRYGDELPAGAIDRLGTVRLRHGGHVGPLVFLSGAKELVSGGNDCAKLWDVASGRELRRFVGRDENDVGAMAVSSDGKLLASTTHSGTIIRVWEIATGKELRRFTEKDSIWALAFSPDNKQIAAGGKEAGIRLWNVTGGQGNGVRQPTADSGIEVLIFTPDGKSLVSAGDFKVSIWDTSTGRSLRRFTPPGPGYPFRCIALSRDGTRLASGPGPFLWDMATGKQIRRLWKERGSAEALAFSPDGRNLAVALSHKNPREQSPDSRAGQILILDTATGKQVLDLGGLQGLVYGVAFSQDGRLVAAAGLDNTVRLFEAATGKELVPAVGHRGPVNTLAFSPDGRTVATAGWDATVRLWEAATGKELRRLEQHQGPVTSVAFSPDGQILASGSEDGTVRLWEAATGKELRPLRGAWIEEVSALAFSADGRFLASGDWGRGLWVWEVDSGKVLWRKRAPYGADSLAFSPDGRTLASGLNGRICLWEFRTGRMRRMLGPVEDGGFGEGPEDTGCGIAFSPDGRSLVSGDRDHRVRLWETTTGKERRRLRGHDHPIQSVDFSADGQTVVSASDDRSIRLWDAVTGKEVRRLLGHQGGVLAVRFSPNGRLLASGSEDTTALLWDVQGLAKPDRSPGAAPTAREFEAIRAELAGEDACKAFQAIQTLRRAGKYSVSWLRGQLRPAKPTYDPKRVSELLKQLDDERFAVRESATQELRRLGEVVEPSLRDKLRNSPSLESRRRAEQLLQELHEQRDPMPSPEALWGLRAIEALELIGTADARQLLETLVTGAPEALLTREAKASLKRLERRIITIR